MKYSNILTTFILFLFVFSFVSAQEISLPNQEIGKCFNIVQSHPNATSMNITKISIPEHGENYTVIPMATTNGINYYYQFCDTEQPGKYVITTCGNGDGEITCMDYGVQVGQELTISQVILFGFIFIIIVGLLYLSISGLVRAEGAAWTIFYICASYILAFCLFFILWLFCDNYLWGTPILASIFWIVWLILAILFWPFMIGVSSYILKMQAEALMVKEYKNQGYSPEDSQSLAKGRRR